MVHFSAAHLLIVLLVDEGTGQGHLTSGSRTLFRYSGAFFLPYRSRPGDHARRTNGEKSVRDLLRCIQRQAQSRFEFLLVFRVFSCLPRTALMFCLSQRRIAGQLP